LDLNFYVKPTQDSAIHSHFTASMPPESDIPIHIHSASLQKSHDLSHH